MIWLIEESDDVSVELLKPILASVKKQNQVTVICWIRGSINFIFFYIISQTFIFFASGSFTTFLEIRRGSTSALLSKSQTIPQ